MRRIPPFGFAIILVKALLGLRVGAQNVSETNEWRGFPILPPNTNANPAIRDPVSAHVPTQLRIEWTADMLSVAVDTNGLESTNLTVGTNMVIGFRGQEFVYPVGEPRPANGRETLAGGLEFGLATSFYHTEPDGIPQPHTSYVVEMELEVFETDIPPQHDWSPYGRNYKVLWRQTLKRIVSWDKTIAESSLESLLNAAFPGKRLDELTTILYGPDARQLSSDQWNQLAVAAARELSLQTTNGLVITRETVAGLPYGSLATDTASQAALRRLCWSNAEKVTFLHHLSNNRLISDPRVIEPLINMLDYPGEKTNIRNEAAEVLCQLTERSRKERPTLYEYVNGENNPKRPQYAAWWREWWAKNKNKHPVFDSTIEALVLTRMKAIELQLGKDVATNYSELNYLRPETIRLNYVHPVKVIDVGVDSSLLSSIHSRIAPDGTTRPAGKDDYIYLRITAGFITPPFIPVSDDTPKLWQSLKKEVFREVFPDTDIAITVQAASKDAEFVRQVQACLAKR